MLLESLLMIDLTMFRGKSSKMTHNYNNVILFSITTLNAKCKLNIFYFYVKVYLSIYLDKLNY